MYRILAVNPGSTSTKVAVYDGAKQLFERNIHHDAQELAAFPAISAQYPFRKQLILDALSEEGIPVDSLDAVVGRGGLVVPLESGVYEVSEAMLRDLENPPSGEHASNLGGLIAYDITSSSGHARAFIADPVVVDEFEPVARISGLPELPRISIFHALNHKAVARRYAASVGRPYEEMNLVIAHLGGGISVGAHRKGRVVDVNNTLDGDGPFSPERAGGLPTGGLVKLCYNGRRSESEMYHKIKGGGGLVAHLGTNDVRQALERAGTGDGHARLILDAMCYNVGKHIGAMAAVLHGEVDAVILTGGIARSGEITARIVAMVDFIAPVTIYPGEDELEALAFNAQRVLDGTERVKIYDSQGLF